MTDGGKTIKETTQRLHIKRENSKNVRSLILEKIRVKATEPIYQSSEERLRRVDVWGRRMRAGCILWNTAYIPTIVNAKLAAQAQPTWITSA